MRKRFSAWVVSRPRWGRRLSIAITDGILLAAAMMLGAYWRLGGDSVETQLYPTLSVVAGGAGVMVFWARGLYRDVLRYAGPRLWIRLTSSVFLVAIILIGGSLLLTDEREWSRAAFIGFALMGTLFCGGLRLVIAQALAGVRPEVGPEANRTPLIIYGAGASGAGLAAALWPSPWYRPVAFVDDDPKLGGSRIRDLPVHASARLEQIIGRHPGAVVALAVPSANSIDRRRILDRLQALGVRIMTVPGFRELVAGQADFSQLREVEPDELLGRERVEPSEHLLAKCVTGKSVLVTGAGGSIGSELCRQIVRLKPARLLVLDHSEFALFQIEQELVSLAKRAPEVARVPIRAVLGSVCSGVLVEETMREHKVQTVYHAAAYKHVGMVESNEAAGVAVNTFGTMTLAKAAIKARVETFVLISTDKAVRPTSIMGASKRLAELVVQDLAAGGWTGILGMDERGLKGRTGERKASCPTRFVAVRFGNVLGSSGSVVPRFQKQIAEGGPITVTHPEVTRYFMTISEAVNLVIQAGSLGEGGEIYLLDMGEPVKIVDLARSMIALSGLTVRDEKHPDGDIEIRFIGLQPGEKLHEELLVGDVSDDTEHPKIRRARESGVAVLNREAALTRLESACDLQEVFEVRRLVEEMVEVTRTLSPQVEVLTEAVRHDAGNGSAAIPPLDASVAD